MSTNGIKISALPAASAANATDQLEVNQGGMSRRITVDQLLDVTGGAYLPLTGGTLTGALTGTSATFTNVDTISAGSYFPQNALWNQAADNSGPYLMLQSTRGASGPSQVSDTLGTVTFMGNDTSGTLRHAAYVMSQALTVGASTVAGDFQFITGGVQCLYLSAGGANFPLPVNLSAALAGTTAVFSGNGTHNSALAVGAGANTQAFVKASSTANLGLYYGTGNPSFSAAKGSIYTKTDATTTTTRLWVNTDGSTTWTTLTTAALRTTLPPSGAIAQLDESDDGKLFILPLAATGFVTIPLPPASAVPPGWSIDLLAIPGSGSIGIQLNAAVGDIINDGTDSTSPGGNLRSKSDGAALRLSRVLTGSQAWYVHQKIGNWS